MSLGLPGSIPVAAESLEAILRLGSPWSLHGTTQALVSVTNDTTDPVIVWASPWLEGYRAIWRRAADAGFVEDAGTWGPNVDIDHVLPKSWGRQRGSNIAFVRLFPVWAEVNRGAGAGREKDALKTGFDNKRDRGLIFARELQVLKILGHDVGTTAHPQRIFGVAGKS